MVEQLASEPSIEQLEQVDIPNKCIITCKYNIFITAEMIQILFLQTPKGFFPSIYFDFEDDKRRQITSNFTELASKYGKYPLSLPLHFFVFSGLNS